MDRISEDIIKATEHITGISLKQMISPNRKTEVREARQILVYCLAKINSLNDTVISGIVKQRKATIQHSVETIENDIKSRNGIRLKVKYVENSINLKYSFDVKK